MPLHGVVSSLARQRQAISRLKHTGDYANFNSYQPRDGTFRILLYFLVYSRYDCA